MLLGGLGLGVIVTAGGGTAWYVLSRPRTAAPQGKTIHTGLPNAPALSSAGAQGDTLTTYTGHQGSVEHQGSVLAGCLVAGRAVCRLSR